MAAVARLAVAGLTVGGSASACLRPAEERALLDLEVGLASAGGVDFAVENGLAAVREIEPGVIALWAQAPVLRLRATPRPGAQLQWTLTVRNCMPDAALVVNAGTAGIVPVATRLPTVKTWRVDLDDEAEVTLVIAPPDADVATAWRFAVLSDVQEALPELDSLLAVVAADAAVRFVLSTGDLTRRGARRDMRTFQRKLEALPVPFFSTAGNHDLMSGEPRDWTELFGRRNLHFVFKGTAFTLVDSGNASIDPLVYEWLEEWLAPRPGILPLFFTHVPAIDPVGVRNGSFRSRDEAARLLALLQQAGVAAVFYGHIHTFHAFDDGGIPAYISGGGGAVPMAWDGIGRHFLTVDVADGEISQVDVVRVDEAE